MSDNRRAARVRTRGGKDCIYFTIRCDWLKAKVYREVYVDKEGKTQNIFAHSLATLVGADDKEEELTQKNELICSGWCFTKRQCQKTLDKIIETTPEMGWFNREDTDEDY